MKFKISATLCVLCGEKSGLGSRQVVARFVGYLSSQVIKVIFWPMVGYLIGGFVFNYMDLVAPVQ